MTSYPRTFLLEANYCLYISTIRTNIQQIPLMDTSISKTTVYISPNQAEYMTCLITAFSTPVRIYRNQAVQSVVAALGKHPVGHTSAARSRPLASVVCLIEISDSPVLWKLSASQELASRLRKRCMRHYLSTFVEKMTFPKSSGLWNDGLGPCDGDHWLDCRLVWPPQRLSPI